MTYSAIALFIALAAWFAFLPANEPKIASMPNAIAPSNTAPAPNTPYTSSASYTTYRAPDGTFSFQYPPDFTATSFDEGESTIVLIQKNGAGAQIAISPFDEDIVLTAERIEKDLPDLVMVSPRSATLQSDTRVRGVLFNSVDESGLGTREYWFVYRGNVYQIKVFAKDAELLEKITATWEFQ